MLVVGYLGNHSMEFCGIWYVDVSHQIQIFHKVNFDFWPKNNQIKILNTYFAYGLFVVA